MNNLNYGKFVDNINDISNKLLMPMMAVAFLLINTFVEIFIDNRMETIQNILAVLLVGVFACNFLHKPNISLLNWIKENYIIGIYCIIRILTCCLYDFDYSIIRSIFFEIFFLACINNKMIGTRKGPFYIKLFICIQFLLTFCGLVLFLVANIFDGEVYGLISTFTFIGQSELAIMYGNVNTAGILSGFAITLAIAIYNKGILNNKTVIIYGLYNIVLLFLYGCRSADLSIIVVCIVLIFVKVHYKYNRKNITIFMIIVMALSVIPIYCFAEFCSNDNTLEFTEIEYKIDSVSTSRYVIWKECYMMQQEKPLLGYGSLRLEREARKIEFSNLGNEYWRYEVAAEIAPHNGYIGMISATGMVGLIAFILIMIDKILKSRIISDGYWLLPLIYLFTVNCFESTFVLNRFAAFFYVLLILCFESMETDDDKQRTREEIA